MPKCSHAVRAVRQGVARLRDSQKPRETDRVSGGSLGGGGGDRHRGERRQLAAGRRALLLHPADSPRAAAAASPRYMLYCSLAPSARRGAPRTRRCWQARGGRGGARLHFKYLLSEYEVGVSGCDMPLETQRVCAHFLLKMASSDHQIPKKSAARPYKGGDPPPTPTQIATLTATIMHAWFGPPVDVQGVEGGRQLGGEG